MKLICGFILIIHCHKSHHVIRIRSFQFHNIKRIFDREMVPCDIHDIQIAILSNQPGMYIVPKGEPGHEKWPWSCEQRVACVGN